ncbi:glycosyl transferase group 1 [Deinococcus phoenicis]|uniref:Glycosyl transferase group 1 n=1 Tax=Deinococcus phoenicis TaxID=1476583 RepID=A0A016QTP7_9DEIO|nr:glycosyltransferase [Deinococcus phoenicis]EYB69485.1 glycosyl transferase group 1 [Deinococcus phoenicis]
MRVSIVLEQRFIHTPDGATYDDGHATYPLWQRYLDVFEEVQIVGRSQAVAEVPPGYRRVDGPGVRVMHVPFYQGPGGLLRRLPRVAATLRRALEPQGAVIVRLSGVLAHLAAGLRWMQGRPFAAEVINDPHLGFGGEGVQHPLRRLFRWALTTLTRVQCRQAAAVQYVTRSALQRKYPPHPDRPRFGVSDVYLPPEAFAAPRLYRAPARRAVLVGSLDHPHKAADIVLRALARLRGEGLDLHFTLVGEGTLRPGLEALARELGVSEVCDFVGQRSTPAGVRRDLARAELFLIPSRTEGLPRALLEAMAQGLPALGSEVGGLPELLPPDLRVIPGDVESLVTVWRRLALDPARLSAESARNVTLAHEYADEVLQQRRNQFLRAVRTRQARQR